MVPVLEYYSSKPTPRTINQGTGNMVQRRMLNARALVAISTHCHKPVKALDSYSISLNVHSYKNGYWRTARTRLRAGHVRRYEAVVWLTTSEWSLERLSSRRRPSRRPESNLDFAPVLIVYHYPSRKQYTRRGMRGEDIRKATRDQFSNPRPPWGFRNQQVPFEYSPARAASAVALALIFYLPAW